MDTYSKILIALTAVVLISITVADMAYAKYRTSGQRYSSQIKSTKITT